MNWFKRWKQYQYENYTWVFRLWRVFKPNAHEAYIVGQFGDRVVQQVAAFQKYGGGFPIAQATYYEIGTGGDLQSLIGLSLAGMGKCIGVDNKRLVTAYQVARTIRYYAQHAREYGLSVVPNVGKITSKNLDAVLHDIFRIDYLAPCDARQTNLPAGSIDYMSANYVLEHIAVDDLLPILAESYRVLKKGGVFYLTVDYMDHCALVSSQDVCRVPVAEQGYYHYLQYSPQVWDEQQKWRDSCYFYQNRLRTRDYLHLFQQAGFRVLAQEPYAKSLNWEQDFAKVTIDPYFQKYTTAELQEQGCVFILTK